MTESKRPALTDTDAEDAFNILLELAGNIEASIFMLEEAVGALRRDELDHMMFVHLNRMAISWLILSLAKVDELWPKYGALAEEQTVQTMRSIVREIRKRNVVSIRNRTVAHLFDNDTSRPMQPEQIQAEIIEMMSQGGEPVDFIRWLRHPDDTNRAGTVFATLRRFADEIRARYKDIRNYNELAPGQDLRNVIIAPTRKP